MSVPIVCPGCGATYGHLKLAPGTSFPCAQCQRSLRVPGAPAAKTPVAPLLVVVPTAPPTKNPAPQSAPASPPPPVLTPVRPARSPTVAPAEAAPRPGTGSSRRPSPKKGGAPRAKRPMSPAVLWSLVGGGMAVLVTSLVVLTMLGKPNDFDRAQGYARGYRDAVMHRTLASFGQRAIPEPELQQAYEREAGKKATPVEYSEGFADGRKGAAPTRAAESLANLRFPVDLALETIGKAETARANSGAELWQLVEQVQTMAKSWSERGASANDVARLTGKAKTLADRVLVLDPSHLAARTARGEIRYQGELQDYALAPWLDDASRADADKAHRRIQELATKNGGFVGTKEETEITRLKNRFADKEKAYKAMTERPFFVKASALENITAKELVDSLAKAKENVAKIRDTLKDESMAKALEEAMLRGVEGRKFLSFIREPYVIFVEENDSWDESAQAENTVAQPLLSLNRKFFEEFGPKYGLTPIEDPIPVVFLRNGLSYQQYCLGTMGVPLVGVLAHFEPEKGRLIVHNDTDFKTILHEGTHQLFHRYRKNAPAFQDQSFWFEEGVAEWFGGARRTVNAQTGGWNYELGLLQSDRFKGIKALVKDGTHFPLDQLITATYRDRDAGLANNPFTVPLVYAQGWMLIYFLNYFDTEPDGLVKIDTAAKPVRGKYRDGWERYLRFELTGKDGKPYSGGAAFREAMGLDDAGMAKLADEFDRYQRFVIRKMDLTHVKDLRLIPWDEFRNKRNEKVGLREDDLLDPSRPPSKPEDKK